jgi:hypothetical protein
LKAVEDQEVQKVKSFERILHRENKRIDRIKDEKFGIRVKLFIEFVE